MNAAIKIDSNDTLIDADSSEQMNAHAWLGCPVGARHRIVKHLGSGGMGHVFLAEHVTLGASAAVKILGAHSQPALVDRFIAEAKLLGRLNHPNIVQVFDIGEMDDETPYFLMEHVPGIDLGTWVEKNETLSVKRVLRILRQVACALDHLHGQGIVHRDIKPPNIMVDPDANDAVKLLDFGIAIREGAQDSCFETGLLGTPAYMAPEQVNGNGCGKAADLYALGALALELLTGKPPYDYPSLNLVLAAVLREEPGMPSKRGLDIPGIDAVFERALARDPKARFGTAAEFMDALTRVLTGSWGDRVSASVAVPSVPRIQTPAETRAHTRPFVRGVALVGGGALALVGAALAWLA
ncbi:MAG TPA: serine/threonine-protein kinase [Polyangiales bacterium]|nr:serine/threonine-protein kinase [Polyangiales bacterium]